MSAFVHTLRVVLAGVWLVGVVFMPALVSPALRTMEWGGAWRVLVRSARSASGTRRWGAPTSRSSPSSPSSWVSREAARPTGKIGSARPKNTPRVSKP